MNKDSLIGLGLIGVTFMSIGAIIGGVVVNKINDKYEKNSIGVWKDVARIFEDQLLKEYERNDKLKRDLDSKVEA